MSDDFNPGNEWEEISRAVYFSLNNNDETTLTWAEGQTSTYRFWSKKKKTPVPTEEYTLISAVLWNEHMQPKILYLENDSWTNREIKLSQHEFNKHVKSFTVLARPASTESTNE